MLMESLLRKKNNLIVLKYIAWGFSRTYDLVSWWLYREMKCLPVFIITEVMIMFRKLLYQFL